MYIGSRLDMKRLKGIIFIVVGAMLWGATGLLWNGCSTIHH